MKPPILLLAILLTACNTTTTTKKPDGSIIVVTKDVDSKTMKALINAGATIGGDAAAAAIQAAIEQQNAK